MVQVDDIIETYLEDVAYAVGYDLSDTRGMSYLRQLLYAGIDDMTTAGVDIVAMSNHPLVLTTLTMFVNDNLNMNSGGTVMSSVYVANIAKLRSLKR